MFIRGVEFIQFVIFISLYHDNICANSMLYSIPYCIMSGRSYFIFTVFYCVMDMENSELFVVLYLNLIEKKT